VDLAHWYPGYDLGTEWRARRWRRLLNRIDRLPRNSKFIEAMVRDEELAERLAQNDDDGDRRPERRMADWSVEVEIMTMIFDRLGELGQIFVAGMPGGKPRRVEPAPRPTTAIRKYKDRNRQQRHLALVSQLLPHKARAIEPPDLPGLPQ
jgi:hypothetical protein